MSRHLISATLTVSVALVILVGAGCGSSSGGGDTAYSAEAISNFMGSCQRSAAGGPLRSEQVADYCSCVLKKLEKTMPYEDFVALNNRMADGNVYIEKEKKIKDLFVSCAP